MHETIAAIATPPGEGGINIIRISGPRALELALRLLRTPDGAALDALEPMKVRLGEIRDPANGRPVDQVLVTLFRAPRSYTGEDVVEINGHGGALVSARILQLVLDGGARPAEPGEFTRRAFLNGRLDLPQAEAVADLIHAASDQALATAMDQLRGRLSRTLNGFYERLVAVLAQLEAAIDFPEEGLEFQHKQALAGQVRGVRQEIDTLADSYREGRILREGLKVALVGKPNTGKSSILNALLREDRAIVTAHPGTTRDVLEERVRLRDIHINILDTAGLRHTVEAVEEMGIARTRATLKRADLALAVFDGSRPLDGDDDLLLHELEGKPLLVILNKQDLPRRIDTAKLLEQLQASRYIAVSAVTGAGLEALIDAIRERAGCGRRLEEAPVITRERHLRALRSAAESLARVETSLAENRSEDLVAVDLNAALDPLGGLLGKTFVDDLLDRIFNDFCIGK